MGWFLPMFHTRRGARLVPGSGMVLSYCGLPEAGRCVGAYIARVIDILAQMRFFDGGVVIIVVVINTNKCVAALKHAQGEGRTDETCGSSDEVLDTHGFKLKGATDILLQLLYLPPKKQT